MDKLIRLVFLVLFLTSTTGCSYMQTQMKHFEVESWKSDRISECQSIQDNGVPSMEERAFYPGSPTLYEVVENRPERMWTLKQVVIATPNGVYQCVCTKAVPASIDKKAKVNWDMVQENCLPLNLEEIE